MNSPNETAIKRWHNAYQRALATSPTRGDNILRIFNQLVGTPPTPTDDASYAIYLRLLSDLYRMKDFEERYPLAIVAFGSARLTKEDRYYVLARSVGEGLARRGYLVRTGAGPGIMDAVPVGWKREVSRSSSLLSLEHTQGIRIELPFEQAVSSSIDTNTMMCTFTIRRTALIWNSRAIAVFPGGLGTINELFEAWCGARDHKVTCPIVVIPNSFYEPLLDAIERVAVSERRTINANEFNMIQRSTEDADDAIQHLIQPMRYKESGTQFTLREKLIYLRHELGRGISTVSNLEPALIVVGSKDSLSKSDIEMQFLNALSTEIITKTSLGIRLGVDGPIHDVVTESANKCQCPNRVQRIFMTEAMGFVDANAYFESRSAHCETLLCNAKAGVFLPGDIPALNILFALVCEIQTGRREKIPVYLVGREFWQPIFHGLDIILEGDYDGQYIKHSDLNIMTVIDCTPQDLYSMLEAINGKG